MENEYSAYNIKTDKLHRFVTDEQIKEFNSKISKDELDKSLNDAKKELNADFNKKYDNIFNIKDIYNSIKSLSLFLKNNDDILNMIKYLKNNDVSEELKKHIESDCHINNEDRDRLDALRYVINNSYADWNADESDINFIKNKPTKMKADGGDADTVGGYYPKDLLKGSKSDTVIIGCTDKDDCDYFINNVSEDIQYIIQPIIDNMGNGGSILFREGTYNLSSLYIHNDNMHIKGIGMGTILNINSFNVNASQFMLNDCNVNIDKIKISGSCIVIKDNIFTCNSNNPNKTIEIDKMTSSIIKDNVFRNFYQLYYYGNNIIKDNIYC